MQQDIIRACVLNDDIFDVLIVGLAVEPHLQSSDLFGCPLLLTLLFTSTACHLHSQTLNLFLKAAT
jgi:hypothetical protein